MEWLKKFMKEEDGVTAIEYTLIAVIIAIGILLAIAGVRDWISGNLGSVAALTPNSPGTGS
jgi:pilus assembly protein Flp/PilA